MVSRDDVIRLAREADQYASSNHVKWIGPEVINMDWVVARDERFAALVAAAERESCAQVCEGRNRDGDWFAAEIRARSQA